MVGDVLNTAMVAAAFVTLVWLVWYMAQPDTRRQEEDAAREFFDRHGHWPDEPGPR